MLLLDEKLEGDKNYWLERLSGELPRTRLLPDLRPAAARRARADASLPLSTPEPTRRRLAEVCRGNENMIFAVLSAALELTLHRYTGSEDVIVGTAIHERHAGTASFNRALALRVRVRPSETAAHLLQQTKQALAEAYAHQKYPFERIEELLAARGREDDGPLFHVAILLKNINRPENLAHVERELTLVFELEGEHLHGTVEYDSELYRRETIERFAGHYLNLLRAVVVSPHERLGRLQMLDEAELEQVLRGFNRTRRPLPEPLSIPRLFEAQARRTPGALAVRCGDESVTYEELDARAGRLARRLRAAGAGLETPVGILLERSTETVVALLATLKAGGTYVPLDPNYPAGRLRLIAENVGLRLLVTRRGMPALEGVPDACVVYVNEETDLPARADTPVECAPDALAHVIYTSGSTGGPKGVGVTHRAVIRLLFGVDYVELNAGRNLLQLAPVTFDASTFEIWGALLHGGTLVVVPRDNPTFEELGELIRRERVDTLWLTSSLYNAVIDQSPGTLAGVAQLLIGGEALSPAHVRRGQSLLSGTQIINGYGPTESTTFTCCYTIPPDFDPQAASVPIGKPIANTSVYILDAYMNPSAVGVTGELYIGGDGLARGYLGSPALTAERFIPDPFSVEPGARLYRTGDLARWRADGTVEFLGRADQQVKIRGFRIELGEVEAALCAQPGVRTAAAVVREDAPGEKRLVGYVVGDAALDVATVRDGVRTLLPEYTVPSAVIRLDALPLTPNGKLDRKLLPPPTESDRAEGHAAPRTPAEEIISGIFADLLGLARVGATESFFELGGHSLLAMQAVSRLRQSFGVEVALRSLFEGPTPRQLAEAVEAARESESGTEAPPLRRMARQEGEPVPASFAQQRLWFIHQLDPQSAAYNVPTALRLKGRLDVAALRRTLSEIVRRHESLRTRFVERDGEPFQLVEPARTLPLPVVDLSGLEESRAREEVMRLAREEARRPFDLGRGPLVRARLLRIGAEEQVALWTMHHVVSDGWSTGVLVREVAALYEAYTRGEASPLMELPVQYADYAEWQRGWLQGEALEAQLGYWREQLEGAPDELSLPRERGAGGGSGRGGVEEVEVSEEVSEGLRGLGRREGATLFMVLLAGFQALLYRYTGQTDISVGTDVANRRVQETEGLIGFFVNQLVLRLDLSGEPSFRELLARVRAVCLGAYAHQDVPFQRLVEELGPGRRSLRNPLFQVLFVLHEENAPSAELARAAQSTAGDLAVEPLKLEEETSAFDISLHTWDEGGRLHAAFRYSRDLFEPSTIARMAVCFRAVLERASAAPDSTLAELSAVAEAAERSEREREESALVLARSLKFERLMRKRTQVVAAPEGERELI